MPPHPRLVENLTCVKGRSPSQAQQLHAYMHQVGLDVHVLFGNHVVSMLGTENVHRAQNFFEKLVDQDQFSWNSLISECVSCGKSSQALTLYQQMQQQGSLHPPFIALLKACIELKDLESGQDLHAEIVRKGLFEKSIFVGSTLIDMYVKCGSLVKAQEVFDKIPIQNVVSWTALIAGYAEYGEVQEVFACVEQMQHEGIYPDAFTFVCMLKACGILAAIDKGREIHVEITNKGLLEDNVYVGSSLVSMYIKSGFLEEAQNVFANLPICNVVSWTVLIAGLSENSYSEEALCCLDHMQHEGMSPNSVTYVCGLKACASMKAFEKGQELHSDVVKKGLEEELLIGNTLVDMYSKCYFLEIAQQVFEKLITRTVVSWNALISGYAEHECQEEVLNWYKQMQYDGVSPNVVTFVCCLKACGSLGAKREGQETHAVIVRTGLDEELLIASTLVDMYAKLGLLAAAHDVFDMVLVCDVVLWNALLVGCGGRGFDDEVLTNFEKMQHDGMPPNPVTFCCALKACGSLGALDKGKYIHTDVTKKGMERELQIGNTIIDLYAKCGFPGVALRVLDMLPVRDVVSWNTLISGYSDLGYEKEALSFVEKMQQDGVSLDIITFVCLLKACGSLSAIIKGQEIHIEIIKQGFERDLLVGSTLVDTYAKCGWLVEAQDMFDKLPKQTIVSWNALLVGYIEHNEGEEALTMLERMQGKGICLDEVTFMCGLKACGNIKATGQIQVMHAEIVKRGSERELFIGNVLVDVYGEAGLLTDAQDVLNKASAKDVVAWTALISGYFECGHYVEVLVAFNQMQQLCIAPNALTFIFGLKACGNIGATMKGAEIHAKIAMKGLEGGPLVGNNLVDMYSKCGFLAEAQQVFDKLLIQDMISWNALIAGYAQHGESEVVFKSFDKMIGEGMQPTLVTIVSVLNVCTHAGLVDEGQMFSEVIVINHAFTATLQHYTCIVDLLGRAGCIDRVVAAIEKLPLQPDIAIWHTVLGACQRRGLVELGRLAFEQAVQLDNNDVAAYISFSNICADAGQNEEG